VVVGKKKTARRYLVVRQVNWIAGQPPALPREFIVKIRYRHRGATATVEADASGGSGAGPQLRIRFHEPQQAITPGQFAVFYQGEEVVGSGEICGPERNAFDFKKEEYRISNKEPQNYEVNP
jgi:tRNA-specific 2-thiouridylase